MKRPRLLVISLCEGDAVVPAIGRSNARRRGGRDLADAIPLLAEFAGIEAQAPLRLPSASLSPAHLVEIAQRIEDALADGTDGAVVVQGGDTLEESAFILDLLVGGDKPVVITAASCGDRPGADGHANLLAAARVAASREAHGLGALVVVNDSVHTARFIERTLNGVMSVFVSPLAGPIGAVVDGRARFWARVARLPVLPSHGGPPRPVAILRWAMGDDGRRLGSLQMLGYAGAVVEAMGAGRVPMDAAPLLGDLAARMPVVLASRCVTAPVGRGKGEEIDLLGRGLIPAGCLSGLKARLLLGFALRGGAGHAAAAAAFAPYQ
jgi:L-asparaginase